MAISTKYGRTYHYPFSPGTTSDDRINHQYWESFSQIPTLIHTEKLDGENNCLSRYGVFARSHAAPTTSPWTSTLRQRWQLLRDDLGHLEIFGENLFAIHSIEYQQLESHFYVFAVREHDQWLSWEETEFYAQFFDFPTVPVLEKISMPTSQAVFEQSVLHWALQPSQLVSVDIQTNQPCTMEGVVTRNAAQYSTDTFTQNINKYVRKGHVKTDEHWTRNWKRASLMWERRKYVENHSK